MSFITVTNNGDKTLRGPQVKFNGIPYEFPPGQRVTISFDAAKHIFGLGVADKTDVLSKHGWMQYSTDRDSAMAQLGLFSFGSPDDPEPEQEQEIPEKVELPVEKEQGSAPLQPDAGGKAEVIEADDSETEVEPPEPVLGEGSMLDNLSMG